MARSGRPASRWIRPSQVRIISLRNSTSYPMVSRLSSSMSRVASSDSPSCHRANVSMALAPVIASESGSPSRVRLRRSLTPRSTTWS